MNRLPHSFCRLPGIVALSVVLISNGTCIATAASGETQTENPPLAEASNDLSAATSTDEQLPNDDSAPAFTDEPLPIEDSEPASPQDEELALAQQAAQDRYASYQQIVEGLEIGSSGYSPELLEAYLDLGGALLTLSKPEEALQVYGKALQLTRAENGLYDPRQLPILQLLLTSSEQAMQWEAADTNIHLINLIARKSYAPGDPRRMATVSQLGQWLLNASAENLGSEAGKYSQEAIELYKYERSQLIALEPYPEQKIQVASLYLGVAAAELSAAHVVNARSIRDFGVEGRSSTTTMQCQMVRLANGQVGQICSMVEIPNLDYYVNPSNRKNQELRQHLNAMKENIVNAFDALNQETRFIEDRDTLMAGMQTLTEAYNTFVTSNGL